VDRIPKPDIIHGNSPIETAAAILRHPTAPALFVCHGWGSRDAFPPKLASIVRYVAVSEHARDELIIFHGIPESNITLHHNPVDLERFPKRGPLPDAPKRALVFSNTLTEANHLKEIRNICAQAGISLDVVGLGMGTARNDPESILQDYDLVFAKGRAALEALATGCAVILCDAEEAGEMVTCENYDLLRLRNFGLRTMQIPALAQTLATQLKRYSPASAAAVMERVRKTEGLVEATSALVELYNSVSQDFQKDFVADWNEERRATARFLDSIAPTSNTFFVASQLAPVEKRARRAEVKLLRLADTLGMEVLPEAQLAQIEIRQISSMSACQAGEEFEVGVEISNQSEAVISSLGPFPIHIAYHWLLPSGELEHFEGNRSELYPPLKPKQRFVYAARIVAPKASGHYTLRLTLVQESVIWLDQLNVYSDMNCEVVGEAIDETCIPANSSEKNKYLSELSALSTLSRVVELSSEHSRLHALPEA